jgi:hypothetical protein
MEDKILGCNRYWAAGDLTGIIIMLDLTSGSGFEVEEVAEVEVEAGFRSSSSGR